MVDDPGIREYVSAHFANIDEGDYFALLGYVEMNAENEKRLQTIRSRVLEK
jgi:hypothetical protein